MGPYVYKVEIAAGSTEAQRYKAALAQIKAKSKAAGTRRRQNQNQQEGGGSAMGFDMAEVRRKGVLACMVCVLTRVRLAHVEVTSLQTCDLLG